MGMHPNQRSTDEALNGFLAYVRSHQPLKPEIADFFRGRMLGKNLQRAVRVCVGRATDAQRITWLCSSHETAHKVNIEYLRVLGYGSLEDIDEAPDSFRCDPGMGGYRMRARAGMQIRLSRDLDKERGFVNGALCEVVEQLKGNAVFVARLLGTGNLVLVHPMEEDGQVFLPCCYGYATTIRRAQGASLVQGCIYFDQKKYPAGRGYGYVAVSRFKSRAGCRLYGRLRVTDFLPVGEPKESEVLERGVCHL